MKQDRIDRVEELLEQHGRMVFATAYRILGNAEDAEDTLQEVFLKTRVVHWTNRVGSKADWAVGLVFLPLSADARAWLEEEVGLLVQHQRRTEDRNG